jgi:hypothetical protein
LARLSLHVPPSSGDSRNGSSPCRDLETGRLEILCECGAAGCAERVQIDEADYERVRGEATHFALLDGHQDAAVENIVRTCDGYLVVANLGAAATVARRTNPRAGSR